MVKFRKIKKRRVFTLVILIILGLWLLFRSKNYEIEYIINDIKIIEKYNKSSKTYEFLFQVKDNSFYIQLKSSYKHKKKLVNEIDIKENDNTICIIPKLKKLDLYPLCQKDGELVSYHLIEDEDFDFKSYKKELAYTEKTYNNVNMYYLNDKKYYLWNYKGFYILSNKGEEYLEIFNEDVYNIPLTIKVNTNLLIANYDEQYIFNKFYVINSNKDTYKELELKNEISFDSYFLGSDKNYAYLFDKNNKVEYIIYPKKLKAKKFSKNDKGKILVSGEWETISINTLASKEELFTYDRITNYILDNNVLYKVQGDFKTKLSNQNIKYIVSFDEDEVYYLVDDKLYYYSDRDGEVLVLKNFEWNFNYKNMIYIF